MFWKLLDLLMKYGSTDVRSLGFELDPPSTGEIIPVSFISLEDK